MANFEIHSGSFEIQEDTGSNPDAGRRKIVPVPEGWADRDENGVVTLLNNIKHNVTATTAPDETNDTTEGYQVTSLWVDTVAGTVYIARDVTEDNAVWGIINNNVANEFAELELKTDIVGNDLIRIEDSENQFIKKQTTVASLASGSSGIVAGNTPEDEDFFLYSDSGAYEDSETTFDNMPSYPSYDGGFAYTNRYIKVQNVSGVAQRITNIKLKSSGHSGDFRIRIYNEDGTILKTTSEDFTLATNGTTQTIAIDDTVIIEPSEIVRIMLHGANSYGVYYTTVDPQAGLGHGSSSLRAHPSSLLPGIGIQSVSQNTVGSAIWGSVSTDKLSDVDTSTTAPVAGDTLHYDGSNFVPKPTTVATSELNVSNPPTDAELDAEFGTPAEVGPGFMVQIDDGGGDSDFYFVISSGTSWIVYTGTKAT